MQRKSKPSKKKNSDKILCWINCGIWPVAFMLSVGFSHEVLHLCQFLLKDFFDMEREYESVAYSHSYFMEQILKALRK